MKTPDSPEKLPPNSPRRKIERKLTRVIETVGAPKKADAPDASKPATETTPAADPAAN